MTLVHRTLVAAGAAFATVAAMAFPGDDGEQALELHECPLLPKETKAEKDARMAWWAESRFGMFIHFGLYATLGRHEWVQRYENIRPEDYEARYMKRFNPDRYDAKEWVSRAMANKRPLEASVVVHVCKALAIFRRHRDILDYVDATGMADDPHVAFYRGTALANLREYGQAMLPMRMACDGPNEMVARRYLDGLKYGYDPFSPYEGDWPYFSPCDFAPARWFGEDLAKGEDPFVRCRNFAAEAVVALVEDADYMPEEMLEAIKGQTGERMEKLRAGLEELAKARVKPQPAKVEPAVEDDYDGDDEEERRRLPMRTRFDWENDVDGLDKELLGELKQALELVRDFEQDGMTSEFVRIENHLSQLESLRREHYLVEKNYLEMVWLHDPERALGTLQTFYAQHEDDAFVAALLVYWLAKSGQREKAFALMNRFRLPDERTAAAMLPDWMMACVPFLSEEVKTKLPEAHRRAKETYDAIMSTWRSMNNPRRGNTRT